MVADHTPVAGAYRIRQQWEDAVLKAHDQTPQRHRGKLTLAPRVALQAIDLHVHDLRREFACSLLESDASPEAPKSAIETTANLLN